jgi:hypothetical protein
MDNDTRYLNLILQAIRVCAQYRPMFGQGRKGGLTVAQFQALYGADPFYSWFGLDSPLVYAAHRVSGGMTSLYRQIGIGCQWMLSQVLSDYFGLSVADAAWSYKVLKADGTNQTLALDGRIPFESVSPARKQLVDNWLDAAAAALLLDRASIRNGAVFEVRQGYKSKDSKRQNADVANASNAYAYQYLPVVALLSNQIDSDVALRYARARWLILRGTTTGTVLNSTYVFYRDVVGYDLAGFFLRNSAVLKAEITMIMEQLLGTT